MELAASRNGFALDSDLRFLRIGQLLLFGLQPGGQLGDFVIELINVFTQLGDLLPSLGDIESGLFGFGRILRFAAGGGAPAAR